MTMSQDVHVDNDLGDVAESGKADSSKRAAKKSSTELSNAQKKEVLGFLGLHEMCETSREHIVATLTRLKDECKRGMKKRHKSIAKKYNAFLDDPDKVWDAVQKNQDYLASVPTLSQIVRNGLGEVYELESLRGKDDALDKLQADITDPNKYNDTREKYQQVPALSSLPDNELWRRMSAEFVEKLLNPYRTKSVGRPKRDPSKVALRQARMDAKKMNDELAQEEVVKDAEKILDASIAFSTKVFLTEVEMEAAKDFLPSMEEAILSIASVRTHNAMVIFDSLTKARSTILGRCITKSWAVDALQHLGGISTGNEAPPVPASLESVGKKRKPKRGEISDTTDTREVLRSFKNEQQNVEVHLKKLVLLIEKLHNLSTTKDSEVEEDTAVEKGSEVEDQEEYETLLNEANEDIKRVEDQLLRLYTKRRTLKEGAGQYLPQKSPKYASLAVCHSLTERKPIFMSGYAGSSGSKLTNQQGEDAKFATKILMERNGLTPSNNEPKIRAKASKVFKYEVEI